MFTIYTDFYYDGQYLSDFGYMLCSFNDVGLETANSGSQITFNTVSFYNGKRQSIVSTQYSECITATFQICKNPCVYEDITLSANDYRDIVFWLNRKEFLKFYLLDEGSDYYDYYFEASFNCNTIKIGDKILGIELTMVTNRPYAIHDAVVKKFKTKSPDEFIAQLKFNYFASFEYISDEIGYIHPKIKITFNDISENLPLTLYISHSGIQSSEKLELNNCVKGETIEINYPLITSTIKNRDLFSDFNFKFPTIGRSYKNNTNTLRMYSDVANNDFDIDVEIEYNPLVKVGV